MPYFTPQPPHPAPDPDESRQWRVILIGMGLLVLGVLIFSAHALIRAAQAPLPIADAPNATAPSVAADHGVSVNAPTPAPPLPAGAPKPLMTDAPPPAPGAPAPVAKPITPKPESVITEYRIIRERDDVARETLETLRQQAREQPNAENTMSEERIKALEKSGAMIM